MKKVKSVLLICIGFLFLALGAIGLLLPIWPTTPFVLVSAGCFAGSPKLRESLLKIGFFREYIENYQSRQGLTKRTVLFSLFFLWFMMIISCIVTQKLWITVLLFSIGIAVTVHILWIAKKKG